MTDHDLADCAQCGTARSIHILDERGVCAWCVVSAKLTVHHSQEQAG